MASDSFKRRMDGYWIRVDEYRAETAFYCFKKTFSAGNGSSLVVRACADTRYQLYVNGVLCCEGPCQGSSYQRYYETVDCSDKLKPGENEIVMKVMHVGAESFHSTFKKDRAAAWLYADLLSDGVKKPFYTDGGWQCFRDDSVSFYPGPGLHGSVPEFERHESVKKLSPVTYHVWYEVKLAAKSIDVWGCAEPYVLAERPIPQMRTYPYREFIRDGENEFDAGKYTTAKVRFTVAAPEGAVVRIIYAECRLTPDGRGGWRKIMRDEPGGLITGGAYDTLIGNGAEQTLEPFWYRAFRYVRIEADGGEDVRVTRAEFGEYFYPADDQATFCCSDSVLNKMWDVSVNTLRCCMHEMFVDCPYYEQQQYGMDSKNEALFAYRLSGDTALQRKCLFDLAQSQQPDGLLAANYPSTLLQIIPGFSLFYIFMLRDYMIHTNDMKFVRSLTGTVDRILEGFHGYEDERGLFGVTPYCGYIDWLPGWDFGTPPGGREEPLTVTNLMYTAALSSAAQICSAAGKPGAASDYAARADAVRTAVLKYCYDGEKGLFRNTPGRREYSAHTTLWAVLSDTVTGGDASALMKRTLESDVPGCTFSMNYFMFRALEKTGYYGYADRLLDGWRKMLDMHCTSWCENPGYPGDPRSECHGWSSVPLYELSAVILGVKPASPGFDTVTVKPYTETLEYAEGSVPTPHGKIYVEWHKENGEVKLGVKLPDGVKLVD